MDETPESSFRPELLIEEFLKSLRNGRLLHVSAEELANFTERALESSLHRLRFLASISEELALIEQDYQAVLDTIAHRLVEQVGDLCIVHLVSADHRRLEPVAIYHPNQQELELARRLVDSESIPVDEPLYRQVMDKGEAQLIPVIFADEQAIRVLPQLQDHVDRFGISSLLIVPIRMKREVLGVIGLWRDVSGHPYTRDDQSLAQDVADRAALAIVNSRLYAANLAHQQELEEIIAQRTVEIGIMNQRLLGELAERGRIEGELRKSEMRYRLIAENASDVIWTMDFNLNLTHVSPSVEHVLGYSVGAVPGLTELLTPASHTAVTRLVSQGLSPTALEGWAKDPFRTSTVELEHVHKDGHTLWLEVKVGLLRDEQGNPIGLLGVSRDITERREANERLRYLATHDSLTHLPTRTLFLDRLGQAIERAQRSQKSAAVMMLDMDNFKQINDTLGHAQGDLALQIAARRMQACMRKTDTIARFGGDEFNFVLEDVDGREFCAGVAQRLLAALNEPLELDSAQFRLGASVGIAFYPQDGDNPEDLLWCADKAMYIAKEKRSKYAFYSEK